MKRTLTLAALIVILSIQGLAQGRKTQKGRASAAKPQTAADFRRETTQVANQLKLLTRFLYLYGKISTGFETADDQARRGEASEALVSKIKQDKADVVSNVRNVRVGLVNLAQTLKAKSELQASYLKLLDALQAAANAEQLAAANRFDDAGKALVGVVDTLSDILAELAAGGQASRK